MIMNTAKACSRQSLDTYLSERYISLGEVSAQTGVSQADLETLIAAGCMPGPSYEIRRREELYAYVNDEPDTLALTTKDRFFAKDVIAWIMALKPQIERNSPEALAAELKPRMRDAFKAGLLRFGAAEIAYEGCVSASGKFNEAALDAHFEAYIWPHWRNGTWGICVFGSHDMENIARKTVAVQRMKKFTGDGARSSYSPEEARRVRAAIDEYEAIVPGFSPHDHHNSSRARLVETALEVLAERA